MNMNNTVNYVKNADLKKRTAMKYLAAAIMIILTAALVVGTAYARYSNSQSHTLTLKYTGENDQVYLLKDSGNENNRLVADSSGNYSTPGGWSSTGPGSYSLDFLLANGNAINRFCLYDQNVTLSVFVSEGVGSIENITAALNVEGNAYTAVFTQITQASSLYASYGAGWIGTFEDANNAEPSWTLAGGAMSYRNMNLTVSGTNDYPAAVTLIASASAS